MAVDCQHGKDERACWLLDDPKDRTHRRSSQDSTGESHQLIQIRAFPCATLPTVDLPQGHPPTTPKIVVEGCRTMVEGIR